MDATKNPFWVLRVSLDDDTETVADRIEELEDDEPDHDWRAFARRLQKPRDRLRCEVAWLPGLEADEALEGAASSLRGEPVTVGQRTALADVNLRLMRLVVSRSGPRALAEQLRGIADAWERLDPVAVAQQINAHRSRAGPRARATDDRVRTALEEHRAWMNATVWGKASRLPIPAGQVASQQQAKELARVVVTIQTLSQTSTRSGQRRAPEAVREWIKKYESEWARQLDWRRAEMEALTKEALSALQHKEAQKAQGVTERFCQSLKQWDHIAQPIQLMYQGEGTTDPKTEAMFSIAREFSLSLHNEHGETALAALVVETQRRVFKEAERLDERLGQDEETLAEILRKKNEAAAALQIEPFIGHVGLHRAVVEVTNDHIRFGARTVNIDNVTKLRWGGVREGYWTSYEIGVSTSGGEVLEISTMRSNLYKQVTERLWKACGVRIAAEITVALTKGKAVAVGNAKMTDGNILLVRPHWLKSHEAAWVPLPRTVADVVNGRVVIRNRQEPKWKTSFSLREDWNGILFWAILGPRLSRTARSGTK